MQITEEWDGDYNLGQWSGERERKNSYIVGPDSPIVGRDSALHAKQRHACYSCSWARAVRPVVDWKPVSGDP